ncbi:TerD family protein [Gordonia sp. VNQ95]|uniref:TerD family protein n=1 Tax=Gordonia sp. VNQ95 TaxID=3156619 RepID=UPI0032B54086
MPTKTPDRLAVVVAALDWDAEHTADDRLDLDLTAFVLGGDGQVISDDYFVFFNNLSSPEQAVRLTGGTDGVRSETLVIDTTELPPQARSVVIAVTVYDGLAGFGQVADAVITVDDSACGSVAEYSLSAGHRDAAAVAYATLVVENGKWRFQASGEKFPSLAAMTDRYGIKT